MKCIHRFRIRDIFYSGRGIRKKVDGNTRAQVEDRAVYHELSSIDPLLELLDDASVSLSTHCFTPPSVPLSDQHWTLQVFRPAKAVVDPFRGRSEPALCS